VARKNFSKEGNNRVILATDGDFNVGESSEKALDELITQQKQSGIYLTCLGLGMGNYKDSKLETLAKRGNGNFAYLDNINEAEKVLVKEFTKTLYAVASDAFLHINFNPRMVKEYRLIGFDNRIEALNDSTSQLEGGEVGSGHSLVAIFEIVPDEKNAVVNSDVIVAGRYGTIKLQYKYPGKPERIMQQFSIPANYMPFDQTDAAIQQAVSVAMFGELLKQSKFVTNYSWEEVRSIAYSSTRKNNSVLNKEFLGLIDKAKKIYTSGKKRKKGDEE
jgi:Ca-activated chloride channel family protein